MSTDAQAEAIKTLLATATKAPVYDHDEAQALGSTLPANYTVVYLSRRFGGNVRGETREAPLRRLQTRVNAKTVTNARLLEDRIFEAFEHKTVTIDGSLTHFAYEAGGGVYEYDAGYYTDITDWTFAV